MCVWQAFSNVIKPIVRARSAYIGLENFPKTVIFCRSYKDCGDLFVMLRHKLGEEISGCGLMM